MEQKEYQLVWRARKTRGWPSLGGQYRVDLLLEGVGACSPPREEDREAHGLEELGDDVQAHGLEAALLGKGLSEELERKGRRVLASTIHHPPLRVSPEGRPAGGRTWREGGEAYSGSTGSKEDQAAEVRCALVAQRAGGVDQSTDTVRLQSRADQGGTPGDGHTTGLLGADELLLRVGSLGALVRLPEERSKESQLGGVVESRAEGDGRRLNGRKIYDGPCQLVGSRVMQGRPEQDRRCEKASEQPSDAKRVCWEFLSFAFDSRRVEDAAIDLDPMGRMELTYSEET